ncbi:NADPH:quinone reductase [Bradyrhizobium ottawaense]|uniref:3-keto-5-aminohexanoate cleavage protein n=1 Tax=Bradyrhizobium ottawaense TaxID=931866 RepID=UPI000BE86C34|nr:3-keto-5-aminohexanoate cleavage protein [Bradyrhizobium ottawaense]PDT64156.1 NADPH:quinone reductase [Bradyrhizobium ottawaense]
MSRKVVVSCAVTGGSSTVLAKHSGIPRSPSEIVAAAVDAAKAGAAIVHIHVREDDGTPSGRLELFEQVVKKLRDSSTDVIVNLTCSLYGTITLDSCDPPTFGKATKLRKPKDRVIHAIELKPEIATLDCGVMSWGDSIYVARMSDLRQMTRLMQDAGVKPEIECFELGHIENAKRLIKEGTLKSPPLFQFCLSTGYGAPAEPLVLQAMREILPSGAIWGGFGCGADEMPTVAQIVRLGGHVRVGLEDNIYLRRGVLASNTDLVESAVGIIERMGASTASPSEARQMLGLEKRG